MKNRPRGRVGEGVSELPRPMSLLFLFLLTPLRRRPAAALWPPGERSALLLVSSFIH